MQFTTTLLAALTVAAVSAGVIEERGLQDCGGQPYLPSKYTCYPNDNFLLCPISGGVVFKPCGADCYDPNSYVCIEKHLCPVDFPLRCGTACYNCSEYFCSGDKLHEVSK